MTRDEDLNARLKVRSQAFCLGTSEVIVAGESRVPMELLFGLPAVTAHLAEREVSLLIDSGAEFSLICPEVVEELDVPVAGRVRLSLVGDSSETFAACLPQLSVGTIECRHMPFVVSPGHLERHLLGITIEALDGALGMPFLRHAATTLDFVEEAVTFTPCHAYAPPCGEGVHVIPLRVLPDGRLCAPVSFAGETYSFLLDTGARRCVLRHDVARAAGLPSRGTARLLSLGAAINASITELPLLTLGSIAIPNVRAYVMPEGQTHLLKHVDGLLGLDFLRDFTLTIDPAGRQLVLIER